MSACHADAASRDGSREGRAEWRQDAADRLNADERTGEEQALLPSSVAGAPADEPWYYNRQVHALPALSTLPAREGGLATRTSTR